MSALAPVSSSAATGDAEAHAAIAFFDQHPQSFVNLQRSNDQSWQAIGRAQLAAAVGITPEQVDPLKSPANTPPAGAGWLPSADAEQAEIEEFFDWAHGEHAQPLVREVIEELPAAVYASVGSLLASASIHDFSPRGRIDDIVFEKHRDVWERITRGCAVLKLVTKRQQVVYRWAARANRKFTGHEDDASADDKLYSMPGEPEFVVISHKCNGSVLHLSARDVTIEGRTVRWLFVGSKKVHVGAVWERETGAEGWLKSMRHFQSERHEVVGEMVQFVAPRLQDPSRAEALLDALALYRLTLNAEYVSAIGTGPTDNERLYGLAPDAREAFAFMLTFSTLYPARGSELGLDMMFGLHCAAAWGFSSVSAFQVPVAQLAAAKAGITALPDTEGAVLYYSDARGLLRLEKWKSSGYVVLRAVREKLRPFIYGNKATQGLDALAAQLDSEQQCVLSVSKVQWSAEQQAQHSSKAKKKNAKARKKAAHAKRQAEVEAQECALEEGMGKLRVAESDLSEEDQRGDCASSSSSAVANASVVVPVGPSVPCHPDTFLELRHPQLDALGAALAAEGGRRCDEGVWRVPCPLDEQHEAALRERLRTQSGAMLVRQPLASALQRVTHSVRQRISSIDHIPISDEERAMWIADSQQFLEWLQEQLVTQRRWKPRETMNMYSKLWSLFRQEREAALAGTAAQAPSATEP